MLYIENLSVSVGSGNNKKRILKDFSLHIENGEVHVLFGPNGSGKSTLVNCILGFPGYSVDGGRIIFKGKKINNLPINERIKLGIGVVFQYPPVIRGVRLNDMANLCLGQKSDDIDQRTLKMAKELNVEKLLEREVNYGFSGGEKKRAEVLQVLLQDPDFLILDEPDSGVDVENVELLGKKLNEFFQRDKKQPFRKKSGLIITHLGYILNFIEADRAHVMCEGYNVCSGHPKEILNEIMKNGFEECGKTCLMKVKEYNKVKV
ncbi:MAG: ABC transporter ATP-binding protein [Promethearchaeota archaeon]